MKTLSIEEYNDTRKGLAEALREAKRVSSNFAAAVALAEGDAMAAKRREALAEAALQEFLRGHLDPAMTVEELRRKLQEANERNHQMNAAAANANDAHNCEDGWRVFGWGSDS